VKRFGTAAVSVAARSVSRRAFRQWRKRRKNIRRHAKYGGHFPSGWKNIFIFLISLLTKMRELG
jgi:hypothetical protein